SAALAIADHAATPTKIIRRTGFRPSSVHGGRGRSLLTRELLLIDELEIDRIEMYWWKTGARDRVGNRFANVGKQHVGTVNAHDRLDVAHRHAPDLEDAGLRRLDEEQRL